MDCMSALNGGHRKASGIDNDTVFPYFDIIAYRCCFNDRVGTDVDMVCLGPHVEGVRYGRPLEGAVGTMGDDTGALTLVGVTGIGL